MARGSETIAWDAQFADIVNRHARFVFQVAYSVLRNSHDAEDAVQDVFLKVYRRRLWEAVENERAFLARAAWRAAGDRAPKRGAELPPEIPSPGENPEQA